MESGYAHPNEGGKSLCMLTFARLFTFVSGETATGD